MPKSYLVPMVALMLVIGAFAIQNNYHDVVIMLVLGISAWIFGRFGFPAPPIVLGLLLGPIAEQGFAQALMIGRAKDAVLEIFFGRPISLILIGCILAAILLPPILRRSTINRFRIRENVSIEINLVSSRAKTILGGLSFGSFGTFMIYAAFEFESAGA